jgi:hypothetical protein
MAGDYIYRNEIELACSRERFRRRHGVTLKQIHRLTLDVMQQIDRCKSDAARRLLLGMSRQYAVKRRPERQSSVFPLSVRRQRAWLGARYGLSETVVHHLMPAMMQQLERCKSEAARRLLLGVSQKFAVVRMPKKPVVPASFLNWYDRKSA